MPCTDGHQGPSRTARPGPSIHRSFVVRLYGDSDQADDRICGLAEHMVTGLSIEFQSVDELVRFMRRVVATRG